MCGIVGVACSGPMSHQMKDFFKTLLFHDVVRGHHATGVAAIDTINQALCVEKRAVSSPVFLSDAEIEENLFATRHNFNIYVGHNRWATSGRADADENAHPFIQGDIVGVHNGSIRDCSQLDDHKDFVVDSDNLLYHLDRNGLNDTILKANGAYALVWYDRSDNTLNFVRNEDRPLAIGKLTNGCYVWASEIGMLKWLVKRHKQLSFAKHKEKIGETEIEVDTVWNLAPFTHMKVDFRGRTMGDTKFTVKTKPTFPTYQTRVYYGGSDQDYYDAWASEYDRQNNCRQRTTRPAETDYTKKAKELIQKWLPTGNLNDWIEVEYMGMFKERSSTGYEATMSLFKYQSVTGKVVMLYSFNHNNCLTRNWTDADIGKRVFGQVSSAMEHSAATYDCQKNAELGAAFAINGMQLTKPARHFSFWEGSVTTIEGTVVIPASDKKEGTAENTVVPFRGRATPQQQAETKTQKENGSSGSQESLAEPSSEGRQDPVLSAARRIEKLLDEAEAEESDDAKVAFLNRKVLLANRKDLTYGKYLDMFEENKCRCAECSLRLSQVSMDRMYLHEHFDRSEGTTYNYLLCSRRCFESMKEVTDAIDEDYDKHFGGRDA